jgi:plasmid maintenance system antidote protein VapI
VILYARACLRNGLLTESRLARRAGLSQPHVHNLLHGVRSLTPATADALLAGLSIRCTLDLYTTEELRDYLDLCEADQRPLAA